MRISDWSSDVCSSDLYSFYTAWHLTVLEFGISIARVALCRDAVTGSLRPPSVDVVAAAKRPLRRGETLDGIGGYMSYCVAGNHAEAPRQNLLPMGLAEGCTLQRDPPGDGGRSFAASEAA